MVEENLNNNMIPVGTTVHIDPEDIKWEVKGDLISRSALKKSIKSYADDQYAENEYLGEYAIMNIIDNAPTVEYTFEEAFQKTICENKLYCPNKRPQGEWIGNNFDEHVCNRCGHYALYEEEADGQYYEVRSDFCPNCGAKMGGKEE